MPGGYGEPLNYSHQVELKIGKEKTEIIMKKSSDVRLKENLEMVSER